MKIGIVGPVNPYELREFLYNGQKIQSINKGATAVNTYIKELLRKGHSVIAITSAIPSNEKESYVIDGEKLRIHVVCSKPGLFLTHALSRFYMVGRLKKTIGEIISEINVLHAQWTYDFAYASMAFADVLPVFCTVRDWCPYIISVQNGLKKLQWMLYYIQFYKVMNNPRLHFVANSEYTKECIQNSFNIARVPVIYNPIDKNLILKEKKYEISNPVFISIASSAYEKRKNITKLLEAFRIFHSKHSNSILKLVGTGFSSDNPLMIKYGEMGLLGGVELCGYKTHNELVEEIDKSTCLIHPSLEETFGNILIEGMARCVPVIGGIKSGAVPKVLGDGEWGFLCDITDVNSMVKTMEDVFQNKDLSKEKVRKATEVISMKYGSDSIADQHIKLYNSQL